MTTLDLRPTGNAAFSGLYAYCTAFKSATPVTTDMTSTDVTNYTYYTIDGSALAVDLSGFSNGVTGQEVEITCIGEVVIKHIDAAGTQKIITSTRADKTIAAGVTAIVLFVFNGTYWFEVNI